uniref:Uncharacterized protein n=1 Tax=Geladintestivirus 6 TaxID=3233138 RepID=A0AAU8MHG0_9CAUD
MLDFVQCMVEEHSQLVVRTQVLHEYIYSDKSNDDNKAEFANKCIQLAAMKKYEEALRARLENQGVFFENGQYFERVSEIKAIHAPETLEENQNNGDK